ncbi:hypothetical protein AB0J83_26000 [Actinoplanes sp. NPDC049596]|uniref:hypothetical protein n=1 Tax=unclassified Actinoplanes TaxID=2626549 RepID=UPI003439F486
MRVLPVASVVVMLTAGCTQAEAPAPSPPRIATADPVLGPPPDLVAEAALPLDAYTPNVAQLSEVDRAIRRLLAECDGSAGAVGEHVVGRDRRNRLGVTDPAAASTTGYHEVPAVAPGESARTGACLTKALRRVRWDAGEFAWLRESAALAASRARADPAAAGADARWSACMAQSSLSYRSPDDAEGRWAGARTRSAEEVRTAVADAACKRRVNYVGELTVLLAEQERRIVTESTPRLVKLRRMADVALGEASALLGADGAKGQAPPPGGWRFDE